MKVIMVFVYQSFALCQSNQAQPYVHFLIQAVKFNNLIVKDDLIINYMNGIDVRKDKLSSIVRTDEESLVNGKITFVGDVSINNLVSKAELAKGLCKGWVGKPSYKCRCSTLQTSSLELGFEIKLVFSLPLTLISSSNCDNDSRSKCLNFWLGF